MIVVEKLFISFFFWSTVYILLKRGHKPLQRILLAHEEFRCLLHIGKTPTFHVSRNPTPFLHRQKYSTFPISRTPLHFSPVFHKWNIAHYCMQGGFLLACSNMIFFTPWLVLKYLRVNFIWITNMHKLERKLEGTIYSWRES